MRKSARCAREKKFEEQSYIQDMCQRSLQTAMITSTHIWSHKERRLKRERLAFLGDRLPFCRRANSRKVLQLTLTLPKIYPDAIEQLCERMHNQFLEIIVASRPGEVINTDWDFYELATTIFECSNCDKSSKRILRYDEAMLHSCTRKYDFPAGCQDSYFIEKFLGEKYRSHNRLTVSKTALKLVPILARLCGLNPPRTATSQMMDYHNPIFECIPCGSPGLGRATMTWLGAVFHFSNKEHDFDMEDWMKFRRLNVNEEDVARRRIIEMRERAIASVSDRANPLIQCAHCSENASKAKLMAHVKSAHGIKNPTDKDIMLNVDANHIPDIFYMWPPRKPEQHQE
ncbi:hypothetical protein BJ912DRAFT_968663 [Pholiota molesta]|nr:hypothetical protein BJ912DRAFT_968663 [Pholiota molesta]